MSSTRRLAVMAVAALLTSACASAADRDAGNGLPTGAAPGDDGRIHVVAGENLWGDIAKQIGGDRADVTSIISDPGQDPHEYQGGVGDAALIDRADVVIVNGVGYDPFMNSLLSADDKPGRTVLTIAKIVGAHSGDNPHLWYDPVDVLEAAKAIEKTFATEDARHATQFRAGLASFVSGEQHVSSVIGQIKAGHAGEKVGYTEPVPGYLVQAAGLDLGTPKDFSLALENGTDPTPGDSAHFEQAITDRAIRALLLNTQVGDPETARLATLARSNRVPIVNVTETLPRGENFQTWQAGQANALLRALDA